MRIYDISVGISPQMPVWPGDTPLQLERVAKIEDGSNSNVSRLSCSVHIGTHVDAPNHFIDGAEPVESLPLEILTGEAYVVDLAATEVVDADALGRSAIPENATRVLLKTRNSSLWDAADQSFRADFVAVDQSGAEWLAARGVRLVGADYLSVAPYSQSVPTHQVLLQSGVVVVEGLDLSKVDPGWYSLYCLPLKLLGSDGAPARAILVGD